jgi:very-short-patch-repair endonuclease/predicted transcriptional regulator of viral defense system
MGARSAETANDPDIRGLVRFREREREIGTLARKQHGVVARDQLIRLGFEEGAIERRLGAGRLHEVRRGVYAVGHQLLSREGRWMAAVLASGPDAVLSHWSAAALWMIRPNSRSIIDVTDPVKSRTWDGIRRHHKALPADEVTVVEGIPVTSVPRTIFDLAATEDSEVVGAMIREMEFRELRDPLSLWDLVRRYPRRRGVARVRLALERLKDEPEGGKKSPLEERFAPFLRRHDLPIPRFNDSIVFGGKRYEVDCHWPGTGEIVELDGWQGHKTRTAFREDRARDRRLRAAGYGVTRLTWNQLDDEPEAVVADLRALLAS